MPSCAQIEELELLTSSSAVVLGMTKLAACGRVPPDVSAASARAGGMGAWITWMLLRIKKVCSCSSACRCNTLSTSMLGSPHRSIKCAIFVPAGELLVHACLHMSRLW